MHSILCRRCRELRTARLTDELRIEALQYQWGMRKWNPSGRIVDLLLVISFYCGVVRLLEALQID